MLPGGQFSKKAARVVPDDVLRVSRAGRGQAGERSRGPPRTGGSRGTAGMPETIEAVPEAGRSFSGVCACGYFYTPPATPPPWRS